MFLTFFSEGIGDGVNDIRGDGERFDTVTDVGGGGERVDCRLCATGYNSARDIKSTMLWPMNRRIGGHVLNTKSSSSTQVAFLQHFFCALLRDLEYQTMLSG